MEIRELERREVEEVWSIDRSEVIDRVYLHENGDLALVPRHHDVRGWPEGEPEHYGPLLLDCFDRGGTSYGAFDDGALIGAALLESRFIGSEQDRLQLKFLHVSRRNRSAGLGRALFGRAVSRAAELGARWLYVSATPSENTVRFYLRLGCRVAREVDPALFELEPEDIHLELDLPT